MLLKCSQCGLEQQSDSQLGGLTCLGCGSAIDTDRDELAESSQDLGLPETIVATTGLASAEARTGIHRYHLIRSLGCGGFGEVFLAHDEELDRLVALKVPRRDDPLSEDAIERFLEEARLAARLNHPGIVTVYDFGRSDELGCFIAMEYVEGETLAAMLKSQRSSGAKAVSCEQAASIVAQVAVAAHDAHKSGVIHRDIKPSNILIDQNGTAHILDFGIGLSDETFQRPGGFSATGTPRYMPPEQSIDGFAFIDGRADIWSLGVVLYQMLTGKLPFQGNMQRVMDGTLKYDPKPLRQIDDEIPVELERITLRCLSKQPRERYSTARDLADELNAWIENQREQTEPAPQRSFWQKVQVATVAAALLMATFGLTTGMFRTADQPPSKPQPVQLGAWNDMLQQVPDKAVFPGGEISAHLMFDHGRRTAFVTSRAPSLCVTGVAKRPDFRLQTGIAKHELGGIGGLCFAIRPAEPDKRLNTFDCQAVMLKYFEDKPFVVRSVFHFERARTGEIILQHSRLLCAQEVEDPYYREALLTLVVKRNRLEEVRWDGQVLSHLTNARNDPDIMEDLESPMVGAFGIYNAYGGTTFANHYFMPEEHRAK